MEQVVDWERFTRPFRNADRILADLQVLCGLSIAKNEPALQVPLDASLIAAAVIVARAAIQAQMDDIETTRLLALFDATDPPAFPLT